MSENNMSILYVLLTLAVFSAGAGAIWFGVKTHTTVRTHTIRVEKSLGKFVQTIDGAQIGLKGGKCDVYRDSKSLTIRCHA